MKKRRRLSFTHRVRSIAFTTGLPLLEDLKTPFSLFCKNLLETGKHEAYVGLSVNPLHYCNAEEFRRDYLAAEMFSKFPALRLSVDRKRAALDAFHAAEGTCAEVNEKFRSRKFWELTDPELRAILWSARIKIERLLRPFNWDEAESNFGFGPGATASLGRAFGDAYYKFGSKPDTTRNCALLALTAVRRVPLWYDYLLRENGCTAEMDDETLIQGLFNVVAGSRIITVPKNAKTDRTIAAEPLMNGFIQKGIGSIIRSRLKRVGIDLRNQSLNQELARIGSIDGSYSTIDLKAASDSLSLEVVRHLLPPDWVAAIEYSRSPRGVLPSKQIITFEKVSSMGNGFTFELETLIFWAISSAVLSHHRIKGRVQVYGDDIIVPTDAAKGVIQCLNYIGFTVNKKKTFFDGPFRESCGKHYFRGTDVTPFYIRSEVNTYARYVWLANAVKRHASDAYWMSLRHSYKRAYELVLSSLPPAILRLKISDGYGDGGLVADLDDACPKWDRNLQGFAMRCFVTTTKQLDFTDDPFLLRALFNQERSERGDGLDSPNSVSQGASYRLKDKVYIPLWRNLGTWSHDLDTYLGF